MKFTLIFIDCKKIVSCFNVFAACEKGKHGFYCEKHCVFPYYIMQTDVTRPLK